MYNKYFFEVLNDVKELSDGRTLNHEEVICRLETEYGVVEIQNFNDSDEEEPFCYPVFIYLDGSTHSDPEEIEIIDNVYGYDSEQLQKVCLKYMDYMVKDLKTEHHFILSEMECCYLVSIINKYKKMNNGIEDVYTDVINKIYRRYINEE